MRILNLTLASLAATILTLVFVPVFYAIVERMRERAPFGAGTRDTGAGQDPRAEDAV